MAAEVTKSLLMAELGAEFVKAHELNKSVKPEPKGELPGGIRNGIARLVQCKIVKIAAGKKNAGKLMFFASGSVFEPKVHEGITTKGKFTQISEPLFDTPTRTRKTVKEHIKAMYEVLVLLGLKVDTLKPDLVELAMQNLKNKHPYFQFRTWKPPMATEGQYKGKETMTMHFWDGFVEYTPSPEEKANAMQPGKEPEQEIPDHLLDPDASPEMTTGEAINTTANGVHTEVASAVAPTTANGTSTELIDPDAVDQSDIDSLAKRADEKQDLVAMTMLIEQAQGLGIDQKIIDTAETFAILVQHMRAKSGQSSSQEETVTIGIGDHWLFFPLDPRTKQKMTKAITIEVESINEEKGTVDCCNLAMKAMKFKNIPVGELSPVL